MRAVRREDRGGGRGAFFPFYYCLALLCPALLCSVEFRGDAMRCDAV